MTKNKAFAAHSKAEPLKPFTFERRTCLENDINIDITYCGVCHSDIHMARGEWGEAPYPLVPGHEIVGRVTEVGSKVKDFKTGDLVGVGCLVDSCQTCSSCEENLEQYCENGATMTYASTDKHSGGFTYGGYSQSIVVDKNFVVKVPENLLEKAVAPLLCAGITTYSPLKHWGVKRGDKVGIVGLGGLGHMGVKLAKAMGAKVVMITTSKEKAADAKRLGADEVLISKNTEDMSAQNNTFDFILNTIPVKHDVAPYMDLLKRDSTMVVVGAFDVLDGVNGGSLIIKRKRLAGSVIGGIKETQEMLDFCGEHNIVSDVEIINMDQINEAFDRVVSSDIKYRFVIDMKSLN